jgi:drug/metabolite transporter (DMT)-like permease
MPVIAVVMLGERPVPLAVFGIALAIVAIVLVSQQPESASDSQAKSSAAASRSFSLALLAGVAIGLFFFALARAGSDAGLWPLGAARAVSVLLFTVIALITSSSLRMDRPTALIVVGGGAIDLAANALYLIATWEAPLSVVVTLSSLYPASTILLARVVLAERLSSLQTAGVGCALTAVVLIVKAP